MSLLIAQTEGEARAPPATIARLRNEWPGALWAIFQRARSFDRRLGGLRRDGLARSQLIASYENLHRA